MLLWRLRNPTAEQRKMLIAPELVTGKGLNAANDSAHEAAR